MLLEEGGNLRAGASGAAARTRRSLALRGLSIERESPYSSPRARARSVVVFFSLSKRGKEKKIGPSLQLGFGRCFGTVLERRDAPARARTL